MSSQYTRSELLLGRNSTKRLKECRVAIFGVGGVGGGAVEAVARAGVGTIDVIDNDEFDITNLNRQLLCTYDTLGKTKVDVAADRIHSINPKTKVNKHKIFYLPGENDDEIDFAEYDYIIDAIDTMKAKIDIVMKAKTLGIPIISCMGCGSRIDPSKLTVTDLFKTKMDPFAKIMRKEMRGRGVKKLKVVYSTETPLQPIRELEEECLRENPGKRQVQGSTSFVPPAAGFLAASTVVRELIDFHHQEHEKGGRQ